MACLVTDIGESNDHSFAAIDDGKFLQGLSWSPDSTSVAGSDRGWSISNIRPPSLWVLYLGDKTQKKFGDIGGGDVKWSPDGLKLACIYNSHMIDLNDEFGGLWVINSDGSDWRRVVENETVLIDWSSDSNRIVYRRYVIVEERVNHRGRVNHRVSRPSDENRIVDLDGSNDQALPNDSAEYKLGFGYDNVSPDGELKLCTIHHDEDRDSDVEVQEPRSHQTRRQRRKAMRLQERLERERQRERRRRGGIGIMNADGSESRRITDGHYASWSPRGTHIAFVSPERALWLMDRDGLNLRQLSGDEGCAGAVEWSPDGQTIAYISRDAGADTGLWTVDTRD